MCCENLESDEVAAGFPAIVFGISWAKNCVATGIRSFT